MSPCEVSVRSYDVQIRVVRVVSGKAVGKEVLGISISTLGKCKKL